MLLLPDFCLEQLSLATLLRLEPANPDLQGTGLRFARRQLATDRIEQGLVLPVFRLEAVDFGREGLQACALFGLKSIDFGVGVVARCRLLRPDFVDLFFDNLQVDVEVVTAHFQQSCILIHLFAFDDRDVDDLHRVLKTDGL